MPAGEPDPVGENYRQANAVLEAMAARISEDIDRPLFGEAVECYLAGALRAAYIMAWISSAESLRNKFAAMAERDRQAGEVLAEVERLEKQGGATDSYLLNQADKLGLVSAEERKKLDHVRDMRNLYAHPRGAGPSAPEVLAAFGTVVEAVLAKPPLLRHGYANGMLTDLFGDRHYLADDEDVVRNFAVGVAGRLHPDAGPYLTRKLIERYDGIADDPELARMQRRGEWFVAAFLSGLSADLSKPSWGIVDIIKKSPASSARLLGAPDVYALLPEQAKGMVFGHLTDPDGDGQGVPRFLRLQQAQALAEAGVLDPEQLSAVRIEEAEAPYPALQDAGVALERYVERLLADLGSRTWGRQNPAASALGNAGPRAVSRLRADVQGRLGRNVLQAADGGSWGAERLLDRLARSPGSWPEPFVSGLLLETLVDDEDRFRLKGAKLSETLAVALPHDRAEQILGGVATRVRGSEPKSKLSFLEDPEDGKDDYERAVDSLRAAQAKLPRQELVDRLILSVRHARPTEA